MLPSPRKQRGQKIASLIRDAGSESLVLQNMGYPSTSRVLSLCGNMDDSVMDRDKDQLMRLPAHATRKGPLFILFTLLLLRPILHFFGYKKRLFDPV